MKTDWYDVDSNTGLLKITEKAAGAKGQKLHLVCTTSNGTIEFAKVTIKIDENAFSGGDGTENNPYLISSPDQLNEIGKVANINKKFKLINDIDLTGKTINTIGQQTSKFNGLIDGNYHTIRNYTISGFGTDSLGFVSYLDGEGKIKNLTLSGFNIVCKETLLNTQQRIGLLVGNSKGQIENCHVKDSRIQIDSVSNPAANNIKSICVGGLVAKHIP